MDIQEVTIDDDYDDGSDDGDNEFDFINSSTPIQPISRKSHILTHKNKNNTSSKNIRNFKSKQKCFRTMVNNCLTGRDEGVDLVIQCKKIFQINRIKFKSS